MRYRAIRSDGTIVEGRLAASGRQEALRLLDRDGLRPIEIAEDTAAPATAPANPTRVSFGARRKVPPHVIEEFMRQLSNLLAAGVSLSPALRILCREAETPAAREQWKAIHDAVVDGLPLAAAMGQFPRTFPAVHVAMVQAGEAGGFLAEVLGQIADFHNRSREMRGKIVSAMIYPAVLLVLALFVVIFLLTFFIPQFKSVFEGFGATLPLITRILVQCSDAILRYGILIAGFAVVAGWATRNWARTEEGRRTWQRWVLQVPIIGPLQSRFAMARFCRMLGTLIEAGVPLISVLRLACDSLGNQTLIDASASAIDQVKKGVSLATSLRGCPEVFPGSVVEIIGVAEETGRLGSELIRVAATTESDLERRLRTAVALVEPLMLFVIASFIATIFIGMVLPIFSLQDYIK